MKKIISFKTFMLLLAAVVINFICDLLIFYGFNGANVDLTLNQLKEAPLHFIQVGSIVGVFALSTLLLPVMGWLKNKVLNLWFIAPYALFVLGQYQRADTC